MDFSMAGFLKRLRRPKEEESSDEDAAPTEDEPRPADSMDGADLQIPYRDDSPNEEPVGGASPAGAPATSRTAGASVRAGGRSPDAPPPTAPSPAVPSAIATAPPTPQAPPNPPALSAPPPHAAPPPPGQPAAPPPPLPEADREAATSSLSHHRATATCFVCGTLMQGTYCPTCRMDWNE
ncbi:MAG: hypothetical protein L3J91_03270 [Thermoplasmata archaeon]|nr:hypothetical protein [Thermoplasmata archaeon]